MANNLEENMEKVIRVNELREELYSLLNVYGLNHFEVLEFSKKLDALILELL